jgi:hypothetical protein
MQYEFLSPSMSISSVALVEAIQWTEGRLGLAKFY